MKLHFAPLLLLVIAASCKSNSPTVVSEKKTSIDQLVFGRFCGMCQGNCSTMYLVEEKAGQLRIDSSDRYFKSEGKSLSFSVQPLPDSLYQLSREVVREFPDSLAYAKTNERFGCPDCADGCGIYLEIRTGNEKKSFYIDYQTENLSGYIRPYADLLRRKIEEMKEGGY